MSVLRSWGVIADRGALPEKRFLIAARLGVDRLRDQSSLVRKEAVKVRINVKVYCKEVCCGVQRYLRKRAVCDGQGNAKVPVRSRLIYCIDSNLTVRLFGFVSPLGVSELNHPSSPLLLHVAFLLAFM